MTNLIFLLALGSLLTFLLAWGFAHLPGERWQILAVLPVAKDDEGRWLGINLTYYGLFIATGQLFAVCLLLVLLGSARISLAGAVTATVMLLLVCIPAARIVAIAVEKKRHTFTVGGAAFVGIVLAPWLILAVERILQTQFPCNLPVLPVLAAMATAYTLGEGLGRLGCISFGCCYGKRLEDCSPLVRKIFSRYPLVFSGPTKKAVYESSLAGEPLVPIQAVTCIISCLTAMVASLLFLRSHFTAALVVSIGVSQLWRILSETLRADFRGFSRISAYQKMGGLAVAYVLVITLLFRAPPLGDPNIGHGLRQLWHPGIIISLQALWLIFFVVFGRSTVTTARLSLDLVRDRL
ncbi:MAG: prolipoprotein diacylglyceryl transferase family protein [Desulfoprunum sp.]|uniref:prolipoprotein diacylglyceryl transferase family protein n=1 Tax=Desulfoprunum sp. TaxID=2020866 RepID=UPI003C7648CE